MFFRFRGTAMRPGILRAARGARQRSRALGPTGRHRRFDVTTRDMQLPLALFFRGLTLPPLRAGPGERVETYGDGRADTAAHAPPLLRGPPPDAPHRPPRRRAARPREHAPGLPVRGRSLADRHARARRARHARWRA